MMRPAAPGRWLQRAEIARGGGQHERVDRRRGRSTTLPQRLSSRVGAPTTLRDEVERAGNETDGKLRAATSGGGCGTGLRRVSVDAPGRAGGVEPQDVCGPVRSYTVVPPTVVEVKLASTHAAISEPDPPPRPPPPPIPPPAMK